MKAKLGLALVVVVFWSCTRAEVSSPPIDTMADQMQNVDSQIKDVKLSCDSNTLIYITSFGVLDLETVVGQSVTKTVELSEQTCNLITVKIANEDYKDKIEITYSNMKNNQIVIPFQPGSKVADITIKGLKAGNGKIIFTIAGTNISQTLGFKVIDLMYPDAGRN